MRTNYGGPMTLEDMFQAIWQDKDLFDTHNIRHVRGVFLYFTACDETGAEIVPLDNFGMPLDDLRSPGPYRSAADEYDQEQELESQPTPKKAAPPVQNISVPFSPI